VIAETRKAKQDTIASREQVFVLWAGDLNGARYAVVNFRQTAANKLKRANWADGILEGPAGAAASAMELQGWSTSGSTIPTTTSSEFLTARGQGAPAAGLVFVTASRATKAEVATARRFGPDGKASTDWRPLTKQGGAVWVGELTAAELYLSDARATGMASGSGSSPVPDTVTPALAVALPGTDRTALEPASDAARSLGATLAEKPVLATSISLGGSNTLAATVLRSPDGGYLFGLAEQYLTDQQPLSGTKLVTSMISDRTFASPESLMVAVKVPGDKGATPKHPQDHYLVIAPAGAEQVMLRGVSVQVRNRLAVVDALPPPYSYYPDAPEAPAQIQALDGSGQVIGTVTAIETDGSTDGAGELPGRPEVHFQDFGDYSNPN